MEIGLQDESNGSTTGTKENGFHLYPVLPQDSGVGMPYAPEDFPNPGDNWRWKVGKRIAASGNFMDRYLYLPTHLQKEHKLGGFGSKLSVERFIMTAFPGTDVKAFFNSFSWKVPSKKVKDSMEWQEQGTTPASGNSDNDSQVATQSCKAGNSMCCSLIEAGETPPSNAISCDVCCSEPDFCRHCCCILCCRIVNAACGGYDFLRCEAVIGEGFVCGHGVHIECGLRSYMAGTVGGSIGLDAEYYCRRCESRTDLVPYIMKLFQTCESNDSQDDIEKVFNICISALRGSGKINARRLLHHIELAMTKLKNGASLEDIWKLEDISTITTARILNVADLKRQRREKKAARREVLKKQLTLEIPKELIGSSSPAVPAARQPISISPALEEVVAVSSEEPEVPTLTRKRHAPTLLASPKPKQQKGTVETSEESPSGVGDEETSNDRAPWLDENFVFPSDPVSCSLLAKKIGTVDSLEKMDLTVREGPQVVIGRGLLKRITMIDLGKDLLDKHPAVIANRSGLLISELAMNTMVLKSQALHARTDKEKAEKALAASQIELEQALLNLTPKESTLEEEKRKTAEREECLTAEKMASILRAAELEKKVAELEDDLKVCRATFESEIAALKIDCKVKERAIIKEYKKSSQYRKSWQKEVLPYYKQGKSHILRMAAASGTQLPQLHEWNMTSHYDFVPRGMHRIVPFSADEVEFIKSEDPTWSPSTPIHENVMYLAHVVEKGGSVKRLENGWEVIDVSSDESSEEKDDDEDEATVEDVAT